MMREPRALVLALAFLLPRPFLAAQDASEVDEVPDFGVAERADDIAVVIGIEKYRDAPPSQFSSSDAALVKSYLKALGFPERNIEYLTNERATLADISKVIERKLPDRVKPHSKVFVYYSGHGSPDVSKGDKPEAYLLPYDGDPGDLAYTGYKLDELYRHLGKLKAAEVMVVLDSCFSGAGGQNARTVLAPGARPLITQMHMPGALPPNLAVLSASQANQTSTSAPDKKHGVLTFHFLKALREGKGALADIYERIKPRVEDDAKALNFQQSPALIPEPAKIRGRFLLAHDLKPVPLRDLKKEAAEKAAAEASAAARKAFEEEKLRLAEEKRRLQEEMARKEAENRRQLEYERQRIEEERRRKDAEMEAERRRLERERRKVRDEGDPAFVPPTF